MTLLGIAIQVGLSGLLMLAPAAVLTRDRLHITIALSFFAILATTHVGGLVFAIPVTVFLLLFSLWVRWIGRAAAGPLRVLFIATTATAALFFAAQVVHLPIRLALHQPPAKIAANMAGILLAAAMLCATLERRVLRKNRGPADTADTSPEPLRPRFANRMITDADLEKIEATSEGGRWYVHNGFLGWAYGSPLNPTPITRATAQKILDQMTADRHPDAVSRLSAFPNALDYAEKGDALYAATGGHRLIAYLPSSDCIFEPGYKVPEVQDFEI